MRVPQNPAGLPHPTSRRRQPARLLRQPTLAAAVAFVGLGFLAGGCENPTAQADKTVRKQVDAAREKNPRPENRAALIAALDAAARVPNASPSARSEVRMQEARQEVDAADELSREVANEEIETARLAGQIQMLAAQVAVNNLLIEGLKKQDPEKPPESPGPLQVVVQATGDAKSSPTGWGRKEGGVPSETMVDADDARIKAEVQKLTQEREKLDARQKQNTEEARKLDAQASRGHGTEARDAGVKAAGLRKQARDDTTRIEQIDRELAGYRGQDDAATKTRIAGQEDVVAVRRTALESAARNFAARKSQIDADWAAVQKQIEDYTARSKALVEGNGDKGFAAGLPGEGGAEGAVPPAPGTEGTVPPAPGATPAPGPAAAPGSATAPAAVPAGPTTVRVVDKDHPLTAADLATATRDVNVRQLAERINQRLAAAEKKRAEALKLYESAAAHVTEARESAGQVNKDLSQREAQNPQSNSKVAWETLKDLFNVGNFQLELASVKLKIAHLHSDHADNQALLARVVQGGPVSGPSESPAPTTGASDAGAAAAAGSAGSGVVAPGLAGVLKDAGIPMPEAVGKLPTADDAAKERADANKLYEEVDVLLEEVMKGGNANNTPPQTLADADRAAAQQLRMAEKYARAKYAVQAGDEKAGTTLMGEAKSDLQELQTANNLPGDLYLSPELAAVVGRTPVAPPPTTAPAGGPTSGPAPAGTAAAGDLVTHTVEGVSLKAPPTWQEGRPSSPNVILLLTATDHPGASVNIVRLDAPPGETIESALPQLPTALKTAIPKFALVSSEMTKVNEYPAGHLVYTGEAFGAGVKFEQYYIASGGKQYTITCTAPAAQFAATAPAMSQIVNTLQLPGATSPPVAPPVATPAAAGATEPPPATPTPPGDAPAAPATTAPSGETPGPGAGTPAPAGGPTMEGK